MAVSGLSNNELWESSDTNSKWMIRTQVLIAFTTSVEEK